MFLVILFLTVVLEHDLCILFDCFDEMGVIGVALIYFLAVLFE
jgi:hypothetical protein